MSITKRQAERAADILGELFEMPEWNGEQRDEISRVRWMLLELHEPCCSESDTGSGMHSDECPRTGEEKP